MLIAEVTRFEADIVGAGAVLRGYAAPASGYAPCTIHVLNDSSLVAASRATNFEASALPLRLGWCGFSLPITAALFPFQDRTEICCGASGRILKVISAPDFDSDIDEAPVERHDFLSVEALLNPESIAPPADGYAQTLYHIGTQQGVEKAADLLYRWLLRRTGDPDGLAYQTEKMTSVAGVNAAVCEMMASDEYRGLPAALRLFSPFDYGAPPELLEALAVPHTSSPPSSDDPRRAAGR